jgi:hypothetical protein
MTTKSRKTLNTFIQETDGKLSRIINDATNSLNNIQSELDKINNAKTSAVEDKGAIQQIKTTAQQILTELQTYHTEFISLKEQLDSEEDGMETNLNWSKEKVTEIETVKSNSEEKLKKIEALLANAEKLKGKMAEYENVTTGYRDKIQATYNFINGQGLAHSFYERKKELETDMKFWRRALIGSAIILIGLVIWFFMFPSKFLENFSDIKNWVDLAAFFLFRAFLLSPVIFSIWYSQSQYSRERREISQYAFKGGVAKALENYTDLLTDKFHDKKGDFAVRDKILDFTISCMKNIYENPHSHNSEHEQTSLKLVGRSIEEFRKNVTKPIGEIGEDLKKATTIIELPKP